MNLLITQLVSGLELNPRLRDPSVHVLHHYISTAFMNSFIFLNALLSHLWIKGKKSVFSFKYNFNLVSFSFKKNETDVRQNDINAKYKNWQWFNNDNSLIECLLWACCTKSFTRAHWVNSLNPQKLRGQFYYFSFYQWGKWNQVTRLKSEVQEVAIPRLSTRSVSLERENFKSFSPSV